MGGFLRAGKELTRNEYCVWQWISRIYFLSAVFCLGSFLIMGFGFSSTARSSTHSEAMTTFVFFCVSFWYVFMRRLFWQERVYFLTLFALAVLGAVQYNIPEYPSVYNVLEIAGYLLILVGPPFLRDHLYELHGAKETVPSPADTPAEPLGQTAVKDTEEAASEGGIDKPEAQGTESRVYVYLLRKAVVQTRNNGYFISSEGVFQDIESARALMNTLTENADDPVSLRTRFTITCLPLNSRKPWEDETTCWYDGQGNLLDITASETAASRLMEECRPDDEEECLTPGDIVFIEAYPWNKASKLTLDTYGVVHSNPYCFDTPPDAGAGYSECCLVVSVIGEDGFLEHEHLPIRGVKLFTEVLPEEFQFLTVLSEHLKGTHEIPEALLDDVYNKKLLLHQCRSSHLRTSDRINFLA